MPHTASLKLSTALFLITAVIACDSKPAADSPAQEAEKPAAEAPITPKEDAPAVKEDPTPQAAAPPVVKEEPKEEPKAEPVVQAGDAKLFEQAPVYEKPFDVKDFPGKIKGELQWGIRFDDFVRDNFVVAMIQESPGKKKNGEPTKTGVIVVEHWVFDGDFADKWVMKEDFKELVSDCEFDITQSVTRGDWSLSNHNGDGRAEVTFAWSSGCRSDVSPVTHKVLMIEDGQKYVLRGTTRTLDVGGEFKADPAFKKAPAAFLKHAELVWQKTHEL